MTMGCWSTGLGSGLLGNMECKCAMIRSAWSSVSTSCDVKPPGSESEAMASRMASCTCGRRVSDWAMAQSWSVTFGGYGLKGVCGRSESGFVADGGLVFMEGDW